MRSKPKQKFLKSELLHGKALWDASYEKPTSYANLMDELRELLRLASSVVTADYDERINVITELEEFLR